MHKINMQDYVFDYEKYKNKIKKPAKFSLSLTIFFVIILLGVTMFLNQPKTNYIEYNFVEIGQYSTYSQASKNAQNLSEQNGAGFIYFDNCYHVFAGFYTTKTDTENVAKNIVEIYPNAKSTTISAKQFTTQKNFTKTQNEATKNLIKSNENMIKSLSKISIELDTNSISTTNLNIKTTQFKDDFSANFKSFKAAFKTDTINRFDLLKYLTEIESSLTNITAATIQELPQKMKYELINIVINHIRFLNAIS